MSEDFVPTADAEDLLHLSPDSLVYRAFVHGLRAYLVESYWCDDDCNRAIDDRRGERMMQRHVVYGHLPSEMVVHIVGLKEDNALRGSERLPNLLREFLSGYAKVHKDITLSKKRDGYTIGYCGTQQVLLFEVD